MKDTGTSNKYQIFFQFIFNFLLFQILTETTFKKSVLVLTVKTVVFLKSSIISDDCKKSHSKKLLSYELIVNSKPFYNKNNE